MGLGSCACGGKGSFAQEEIRRRIKPVIIKILGFIFPAFYGLLPAEITQDPIKIANNVPVYFSRMNGMIFMINIFRFIIK